MTGEAVDRSCEVVNPADLNVDSRYHKGTIDRVVERLRPWDPTVEGMIYVSRREDGSLWVVDGWQRVIAARAEGVDMLLAWVYTGLTLRQEAELHLRPPVQQEENK